MGRKRSGHGLQITFIGAENYFRMKKCREGSRVSVILTGDQQYGSYITSSSIRSMFNE